MPRLTLPLTLLALALVGPGCGGAYDPRAGLPDEVADDPRAVTLNCLTDDEQLDAREQGEDEILVGDDETGPRIRFYLTSGESEAAQFEGKAEGTEQIGSALLFVREGSDDELKRVEYCLDHL